MSTVTTLSSKTVFSFGWNFTLNKITINLIKLSTPNWIQITRASQLGDG
jgi:hypothetical protein